MDAQRLQRPAITKLIIAGWLTAIVACFAPGQTHAQFVNPVPPSPPPTLNPSSPSIVPQSPERPVSPATPNGLSGSTASPNLNESAPAAVIHQGTNASASGKSTNASASGKSSVSGTRESHRVARHWRHGESYAARIIGPSYFPGLGIIYPPYPNPCRWVPAWNGAWQYLAYSCS
jgi:hypothetical protein